jgi:predicted ester cyclase
MLIDELQKTDLTQEERTTLETLYKAFNQQTPDLLDQACTPDWQDIPLAPGQEAGPAGLKKMMPVFFSAFPDLKMEIHEVIGSHGRAAVRGSLVGTHRGNLFGVPATHEKVDMPFHDLHHFRDGRLTHTYHVEDWFGLFLRLGQWPSVRNA